MFLILQIDIAQREGGQVTHNKVSGFCFVYDYNIAVFIYDSALLCLNLGHILSYLCT